MQSRAVRTLGVDITDAGLQQELYRRNIDLTVDSLNGASKEVLIYMAMSSQLSNAQGDAAKTMNSVANQTRLYKEEVGILVRQLGGLLIPALRSILTWVNAILMVANTLLSMLLTFLGISAFDLADEFGTSEISEFGASLDGLSDSFDGVSNSAKGTSKAINEALKSLRGFDKLNAIRTPNESGSSGRGGIGGGIGGGVDPKLLAQLNDWNANLEKTKNKAREIRDSIMEWLGFSKKANGEWEFSHVTLGTVLATAGGILLALKTINDISKGLSFVTGLFKGLGTSATTTKKSVDLLKLSFDGIKMLLSNPTVLGVGAFVTALTAISVYIEKKFVPSLKGSTSALYGTSKETKANLSGIETKVKELNATIDVFTYNGMEMSDEEYSKILEKLDGVYNEMVGKGSTYYDTQLENLYKYYEAKGGLDSEDYQKEKSAIETRYNEFLGQADTYRTEYTTKLKEALENDNKITAEERSELFEITQKINNLSYENLATTEADKQKIMENYKKNRTTMTLDEKMLVVKTAKEMKDEEIKAANDKYDNVIYWAKKTYGDNTDEYKKAVKEADLVRKNEINDATIKYDKFWGNFKKENKKLAETLDKDTGTMKQEYINMFGSVEKALIATSNRIDGKMTEAMWNEQTGKNLVSKYGELGRDSANKYTRAFSEQLNKNKIKINTNVDYNGNATVKATFRANGGFPDVGELFVAREAGPEMVGTIGGHTAVANNDQIVEAISIGVAKAMSNSNNNTNVNIVAKADTEGLMKFIKFKQKESDRQFGF